MLVKIDFIVLMHMYTDMYGMCIYVHAFSM